MRKDGRARKNRAQPETRSRRSRNTRQVITPPPYPGRTKEEEGPPKARTAHRSSCFEPGAPPNVVACARVRPLSTYRRCYAAALSETSGGMLASTCLLDWPERVSGTLVRRLTRASGSQYTYSVSHPNPNPRPPVTGMSTPSSPPPHPHTQRPLQTRDTIPNPWQEQTSGTQSGAKEPPTPWV